MTLLSPSDLQDIKNDINDIVSDTSINTTIKYRQYTGVDFYSPQEQKYQSPYTDWSGVSALIGLIQKDELLGLIEQANTKFVLMQSSVSNVLSTQDVIVESGATYDIKQIKQDPLGIVYILYCEKHDG